LDNFVEDETGELYPDWIGLIGCDTILLCLIGGFVGLATGAVPVLYCLIGGLVGPVCFTFSCRGFGFAAELDAFFRSFANRFLILVLCALDNFVSSLSFVCAVDFTDCGLDNSAIVISFLNLRRCAFDNFALPFSVGFAAALLGFIGLAFDFVEIDAVFSCFSSGVGDIVFSRIGFGLAIVFCFLCLLRCALDNFALPFSFGCAAGAGDWVVLFDCRDGADETDAGTGCGDGGGVGVGVVGLIDSVAGFAFSRSACGVCLLDPFRALFTFFGCTGRLERITFFFTGCGNGSPLTLIAGGLIA